MEFRIQCVVGGASWYAEPGLAREKTICEISRGGKIRLTSVRNDLRNFARALKAGISTFEHPRRCSSVAFHSFCARAKFRKSVSNILICLFHGNSGFWSKKSIAKLIVPDGISSMISYPYPEGFTLDKDRISYPYPEVSR